MGFVFKTVMAASVALAGFTPAHARDDINAYRANHAWEIVQELAQLVAIPNAGTNDAVLQPNIAALKTLLEQRGFTTEQVRRSPEGAPSLIAQRATPGTRRTIGFYAHLDGQAVAPTDWASPPFTPTLRTSAALDAPVIDLSGPPQPLHPEYRLFGRSTSDDKGPIVAIARAIDALNAIDGGIGVNILLYLDGEEERGSPDLDAILAAHAPGLKADLWLLCDGPVHSGGKQQILLGARGFAAFELTAYGPARALHSGHYGNWAPNPAIALTQLVAAMRREDGSVPIPGFSDSALPVTEAEKVLLAALPSVEDTLRHSLAIGRTESGERLLDSIMRPSLNLRGFVSGAVNEKAVNVIPTTARASFDIRLVPGQRPEAVRTSIEAFLRHQGWHLTHQEPDADMLRAHPKVLRIEWTPGYPGYRGSPTLPEVARITRAVTEALGEPPILAPMMGGSIPIATLADRLKAPVIMLPIVNPDNNQHAANENLRLQNLWNGIAIFAAILREMAKP